MALPNLSWAKFTALVTGTIGDVAVPVADANPLPVKVMAGGGGGGAATVADGADVAEGATGAAAYSDATGAAAGTVIGLLKGAYVALKAVLSVGGNVAAGAADSGNPVKAGGVYSLAAPALATGQRGNLQLNPQSRQRIAGARASLSARLLAAGATTNATSAKATAADLFGIYGYNAATSVRYLKLYDKASAPTVGTDTPVLTLALPASAGFAFDFVNGLAFDTGIAFGLTTGSADNDTGALTAGDVLGLNLILQ